MTTMTVIQNLIRSDWRVLGVPHVANRIDAFRKLLEDQTDKSVPTESGLLNYE